MFVLGILLVFWMFIKPFYIVCRTIKHVGGAMRGSGAELISVLVRSMVESKASKNVLRLFLCTQIKVGS